MENITRIGVSVEPELLEKFDRLIEDEGYGSRSEAIRDLIRDKLMDSECRNPESDVASTLTILYKHDVPGLVNNLLELQHHSSVKIYATTHVHLDGHYCLEVLIAGGKAREVRKLTDAIRALRGVVYGKLVLTGAL